MDIKFFQEILLCSWCSLWLIGLCGHGGLIFVASIVGVTQPRRARRRISHKGHEGHQVFSGNPFVLLVLFVADWSLWPWWPDLRSFHCCSYPTTKGTTTDHP